MRPINQVNDKKMRSEVQKAHHQQHRHRHHHSKNKRRHTDVVETSDDEASPVISVQSDTTASDTYFPLAKEHCDNSDSSKSPENSVVRKRRHRYTVAGVANERTGFNSDCDNDAHQNEHVKRRKKQKHKEKKKRKHGKKQKEENDANLDRCSFLVVREKREYDRQKDNSPVRQQQEQMIVRVKQEPLSSDEERTQRCRNAGRRQKINASDRNGHSISVTTRSLKPDRPIKVEPRDHSSSHERNSRADFRHNTAERKNGNSGGINEHRDRRNGRVNGEISSVSDERTLSSRPIEQDRKRRQRSDDRAGHSREHRSESKIGIRRIKKPHPSDDEAEYEWGKPGNKQSQAANSRPGTNSAAGDHKKPNFGLSGKLTEDVNVYNGVVIKYSEPPEARKPKRRWRFYPFKGDEALPTLYIHRQSAYLIGRDRKVADIPVDHPSCSKQHAALQYRLVPFTREDGSKGKRVRPYIIDLESANGTFVNNKKIEPRKYMELMERDVIKFGYSSRDYVLLHEHSKGDEDDDDDQNG